MHTPFPHPFSLPYECTLQKKYYHKPAISPVIRTIMLWAVLFSQDIYALSHFQPLVKEAYSESDTLLLFDKKVNHIYFLLVVIIVGGISLVKTNAINLIKRNTIHIYYPSFHSKHKQVMKNIVPSFITAYVSSFPCYITLTIINYIIFFSIIPTCKQHKR